MLLFEGKAMVHTVFISYDMDIVCLPKVHVLEVRSPL